MLPTLSYSQQLLDAILYGASNSKAISYFPAVDLREDGDSYHIIADLPGLSKEDVTINIEDNILTLSGSRNTNSDEHSAGYYRSERQSGSFERRFKLGSQANTTNATAEFDNGILTISIPKREEAKPKQLDIKVK